MVSKTLSTSAEPPIHDTWYQGKEPPSDWFFAYYPADVRERQIAELRKQAYRVQDGKFVLVATFENEIDAKIVVDEHNALRQNKSLVESYSDRIQSLSEKWGDPDI